MEAHAIIEEAKHDSYPVLNQEIIRQRFKVVSTRSDLPKKVFNEDFPWSHNPWRRTPPTKIAKKYSYHHVSSCDNCDLLKEPKCHSYWFSSLLESLDLDPVIVAIIRMFGNIAALTWGNFAGLVWPGLPQSNSSWDYDYCSISTILGGIGNQKKTSIKGYRISTLNPQKAHTYTCAEKHHWFTEF